MNGPSLARLADPVQWRDEAAAALTARGFLVVGDDHPTPIPRGALLAELRPQPTLHHFDPEGIEYWVTEQGRGRRTRLDRQTTLRGDAKFAWGVIQLVDRLGVYNEFLSFGGALRAQPGEGAALLVAFVSSAPVFRLAGHSQSLDPLSPDVGSFFGRLKIPIDFVPGAEARIASTPPEVLYCAFVGDLERRFESSEMLRRANVESASWARREAARLRGVAGGEWESATTLRRDLGMA